MVNYLEASGLGAFRPGLLNYANFTPKQGVLAQLKIKIPKLGFVRTLKSSLRDTHSSSIILPTVYLPAPDPNTNPLIHDGQKNPHILFHSGRTDQDGGHRDLLNRSGLGRYHFHHGQPPHMPCCRQRPPERETFIVNPYTGRQIALGKPYIFERQAYFSLNLVAKALSEQDTVGVTIFADHFDDMDGMDGGFFACNRGLSDAESFMGLRLGEFFLIVFPRTFFGNLRNDTLFHVDGNRDGRLELLCHTTRAPLDTMDCFAYVTLENIRSYMLTERFFVGFAPNEANIWSFSYGASANRITSPHVNQLFHVGSTLTVQATVVNATSATLRIDGQTIEAKTIPIGTRIVEFIGVEIITAGNPIISVEVQSRNGSIATLGSVSIRAVSPNVNIVLPHNEDTVYEGDSVVVEAEVENSIETELVIGDHSQTITHSTVRQRIHFEALEFTRADIGEIDITVTSKNIHGITASDKSSIQVVKLVPNHLLRALTLEEAKALMAHPNFIYEWDLPPGYIAASGSAVFYSGTETSNPAREVEISDRDREIYRWIFLQEPRSIGKIIGVPVLRNMVSNGGTNTGNMNNIETVLGGASQQRITNNVPIAVLDSSDNPFRVRNLRTVLVNSVKDAFADVAQTVPDYRLNYATAGWHRDPGTTHNHPNAVAFDTNPGQNGQIEPARRQEPGINSVINFHYVNSLDVEQVMERHGWRLGYRGDNPGLTTNGFMHWSVSRT